MAKKTDSSTKQKNLCVATECINDEPVTSRPVLAANVPSQRICLELLQSASFLVLSSVV